MKLPQFDINYLSERGVDHEITSESSMICVMMPEWLLPSGFDRDVADLLIRLNSGYPDVPPDMWWFSPSVHLENGQALPATDVMERYLGRDWQRWSRHFNNGQWLSGIDGLESFLALIRQDMERSVLGINK